MIANYSRILKTHPDSRVRELRKYVDNELVDLLYKYYNENILKNKI